MKMWQQIEDLEKKVLIDCDVFRHFIRGKKLDLLPDVFPGNIYMLDVVEEELIKSAKLRHHVLSLLDSGKILRMNFPVSKKPILSEYLSLSSTRGPGESACMAVARHSDDIIASNNIRDIAGYCAEHGILYLTTIDFLYVAHKKGLLTEAEVDEFLYYNYSGPTGISSWLGFKTLQEFKNSNPPIHQLYESQTA
jgi:hypothetical protein